MIRFFHANDTVRTEVSTLDPVCSVTLRAKSLWWSLGPRRLPSLLFAVAILLAVQASVSCSKNGILSDSWLEAKPRKSLVVPSTIKDYQALLDNTLSTSGAPFNALQNMLGEIGAGDFYLTDDNWRPRLVIERNAYTWSPDIYEGE